MVWWEIIAYVRVVLFLTVCGLGAVVLATGATWLVWVVIL